MKPRVSSPVERGQTPGLRLFVAVPAPPAVRAAAEAAIGRLSKQGDVRWVSPERLHLTLKFLGSTAPENAGLLADILEESANSFYRFVVELGDVGAFPNLRKPQTIWLGVERAEPLIRLAEEIDRAVSSLGFEREARPFRPHLTLGRVRSPRGLRDLSQALLTPAEQPAVPTSWAVNEIELIRSELRPSGPVYTTLHRANLREGS